MARLFVVIYGAFFIGALAMGISLMCCTDAPTIIIAALFIIAAWMALGAYMAIKG